MPNTIEHWKHTPTVAETVFALDLPYRPPTNPIGALIWRKRMWVETTLGLSLLEPWEKLMTLLLFYCLLLLTMTSVLRFTPLQLSLFQERLTYYFYGHEAKGAAVVTRVVSRLAGHNITGEL
ncbi:hypothetical protein BC629DRAFT_1441192 [Irpex lacteus]|nr:hypothetical protein BC629DRAFT_1441192 [Irpex lacteus]